MSTFFNITSGLPWPLAEGAAEMFVVNAGGGYFGIVDVPGHALVVAFDDNEVCVNFRSYLLNLGTVQFTESSENLGFTFHIHVYEPVAAPGYAIPDEMIRRFMGY